MTLAHAYIVKESEKQQFLTIIRSFMNNTPDTIKRPEYRSHKGSDSWGGI